MSEDTERTYQRGGVRFKPKHMRSCRGSGEDCEALAETIVALHDAWIRQDLNAYLAMATPEIARLSQQSGLIQCGRDEVKACMPQEWQAFERATAIDMTMRVRNAHLAVDGDTATALYEVEVAGGKRWDFDDHALYFQAFVRGRDGWKLAYQTDSWNLDFESGSDGSSLEFDYVYPVSDLARALKFYQPILGEPESVTPTRAAFNLGARDSSSTPATCTAMRRSSAAYRAAMPKFTSRT